MRTDSDKAQLYDRQLRLWQKDGQAALEQARVVVFGSSTLASESLKNLVLPAPVGVGEFVVVDDAQISDGDIRTNFFVRPADLGLSRAQSIVDNLCEMNPDVHGSAIAKAPTEFVELIQKSGSESELLDSASLVVACAQPEAVVRALASRCWSANIPIIAVTNAGFIAEIRTAVYEHSIVESHASGRPDLRVMAPFTALRDYADSINLDALDSTDLAHVPLVVLLIKAIDKWAAANNTKASGLSLSQTKEIAALLRQMAPTPGEENFEEAASATNTSCTDYELPGEVKLILDDAAAKTVNAQTSNFWLLVNALRRYLESEYSQGMLPHSGAIPDMKADTLSYVNLQRIYKQKAEADKREFLCHLHDVLHDADLPTDHVSSEQVDAFCRNASKLRLVRTHPLDQDVREVPPMAEDLQGGGVLPHYALFRAADMFAVKHKRHPGIVDAKPNMDIDELCKQDAQELLTMAKELLSSWQIEEEVADELAAEFVRSGFMELHNVSAVAGGVVAQEAIKLITHQYVPHNGICIIDTANSIMASC
ncbi:hypothetical protein IWW36_001452 [Coemansia brasiliensis]|uniref:NEDD8-activating enzyme E1 regulatory subunit n=1 Tax=Coemansia brasiliensis TaxID=2650707 RepID=A0A9W8I917_9FUNG|nr:hypothetical protein IWW36_001452 [Coemansia brasiliensis]